MTKCNQNASEPKDYTFFGLAVTQAQFAALMRSVVQDRRCPFCGKKAFVRAGLIAHAKQCKKIPEAL